MKRTVILLLACTCPLGLLAQSTDRATRDASPWTRVTGPNDANTNEVALARAADGVLHVAWTRANGTTAEIVHGALGLDGALTVTPQPIVAGWKTLSIPGLVLERDGGVRLLFGGVLGTQSTTDPYNAGSLYSATIRREDAKWTLAPGKLSDAENVYVGPLAAVADGTGTVVSAWAASDTLHAQVGLGAGQPRIRAQQSCCPYQPGLGIDGATREVVLGWYSNDTPHLGLNAQVVAPTPKDPVRVPGTVVTYAGQPSSSAINQKVPVSGRIGEPGVYLAYCAGYPSFSSVNLWRLGDEKPLTIARVTTGRTASVTAGPGGRLWVMWADAGRLNAVRSNRAVSRFSRPITVAPLVGIETIYRVTGEGSPGPLDFFAHVATAGSGAGTWHARVYPSLEVSVSPRVMTAAEGGVVTVSVTDVGDPVAGATVKVMGATLRTTSRGQMTLTLPKGTKPGTLAITVAADGYQAAKTAVTVK